GAAPVDRRGVGHGHFNHVLAAEQVLAMIDSFRTLARVASMPRRILSVQTIGAGSSRTAPV
ncbi:hypothetical protein CCR80_00700, partial [Rhodothalassium salexigens]|uniref:hypothetical protein n=1 Tax=Rhodothalassium salexigens TaxID=1086 RepID=UPI001A92B232